MEQLIKHMIYDAQRMEWQNKIFEEQKRKLIREGVIVENPEPQEGYVSRKEYGKQLTNIIFQLYCKQNYRDAGAWLQHGLLFGFSRDSLLSRVGNEFREQIIHYAYVESGDWNEETSFKWLALAGRDNMDEDPNTLDWSSSYEARYAECQLQQFWEWLTDIGTDNRKRDEKLLQLYDMIETDNIVDAFKLWKKLNQLNKRYVSVIFGGKFAIIDTWYKPQFSKKNDGKKRKIDDRIRLYSRDTFASHLANVKINGYKQDGGYRHPVDHPVINERINKLRALYQHTNGWWTGCQLQYLRTRKVRDRRTYNIGELWIKWSERRTCENGITFYPGQVDDSQYNLYQPSRYENTEPLYKPFEDFQDSHYYAHLLANVCKWNEDLLEWVISWMADIIQDPQQKKGTAIAIRGKQGCGKSLVFDILREVIGTSNCIKISQSKHLVGNFNSHLSTALLCQMEQSCWESKKDEGVLKDLITSESITVEFKGYDVVQMPSYVRLALTSNQEWFCPAGKGDRRWLVLDVSDNDLGNHTFFQTIRKEMQNGGYSMMYSYLKNWKKPAHVNLRKPPATEALLDQKLAGLAAKDRFWVTAVDEDGAISKAYANGELQINKDQLYSEYEQYCKSLGKVYDARKQTFNSTVTAIFPDRKVKKDRLTRKNYYVLTLPDTCDEMKGRIYNHLGL